MPRANFLPYARAQAIVRTWRLANRKQWRDYVRTHKEELRALRIPALPDVHYLSEETKYRLYRYKMPSDLREPEPARWTGWTAWLGVGRRPSHTFLSKSEFLKWLRENGIRNKEQYTAWRRDNATDERRRQLPSAPQIAYQEFSWRAALGKRAFSAGNTAQQYAPFREMRRAARVLAKREGLLKKDSWLAYVREHPEWLQEHRGSVNEIWPLCDAEIWPPSVTRLGVLVG